MYVIVCMYVYLFFSERPMWLHIYVLLTEFSRP